ncbi:response regulator transcription factor [Litoribacter populi]|uniref:response regulator transcription factor n=1 Tax=Litoribacter populi TaxID=2598460 RepID=UPI00117D6924|nr:response regulator [Litoribacter populi]
MKRILIVEDDPLTLKITENKLKKEGYQVYISKDGKDGIEKLHTLKPDLVITDLMMPYKSGLEITYYVKKHFPNVPVIVFSALGEEEKTVVDTFNVGANDFISKPFNLNELALRVKRLIK